MGVEYGLMTLLPLEYVRDYGCSSKLDGNPDSQVNCMSDRMLMLEARTLGLEHVQGCKGQPSSQSASQPGPRH